MTTLPGDFINFSKQWEGFRAEAYPDPGSRDGTPWTIGYGQTVIDGKPVKKGDTISEPKAAALLEQRHEILARKVLGTVKVPLSPYQLATLVSFADNVGWGGKKQGDGFSTSTLLRKLNAGDYDAVPSELMKWVNNDGKKMNGLVNRRSAEAGLWAKGQFVSSAPVTVEPPKPPPSATDTILKDAGGWSGIGGIIAAIFGAIADQPILQVAAVVFIAFLLWRFVIARKQADPA